MIARAFISGGGGLAARGAANKDTSDYRNLILAARGWIPNRISVAQNIPLTPLLIQPHLLAHLCQVRQRTLPLGIAAPLVGHQVAEAHAPV